MPKSRRTPQPPSRKPPGASWRHFTLWNGVKDALRALPDYFTTPTQIVGLQASDLFTLNSSLAAMIEEQVVHTLNSMRSVWDPLKQYQAYSFIRQQQTFPDVLLRKSVNGHDILMGIELKGWYLLAKERMPNFRFVVTPAVCAQQDLLVVVPWALSNVLSGTPVAYRPFIELSKYAAEQRNFYWQFERESQTDMTVEISSFSDCYPKKSDQISDRARADSGGNFGRIARYDIMRGYVAEMLETPLCGISTRAWLNFLSTHQDVPPAD